VRAARYLPNARDQLMKRMITIIVALGLVMPAVALAARPATGALEMRSIELRPCGL
jgi:hypothetical protein